MCLCVQSHCGLQRCFPKIAHARMKNDGLCGHIIKPVLKGKKVPTIVYNKRQLRLLHLINWRIITYLKITKLFQSCSAKNCLKSCDGMQESDIAEESTFFLKIFCLHRDRGAGEEGEF